MIDGNEADDKILAVLKNDALYSQYKDVSELPEMIIKRLRHYLLTYKDMPDEASNCEITHIYNVQESHDIIQRSMKDYKNYVEKLLFD